MKEFLICVGIAIGGLTLVILAFMLFKALGWLPS